MTGYNFQKNIIFFSLKIYFILANSADPDEMLHNVAFHLGHRCLPKYLFRGFWSTRGNIFMLQASRYECVPENYFSYFSAKTYVMGTQKNRLDGTVLLSCQNICLN